jgi:outer membrane protein OmpA-like peptidoglycan-associated protein
LTVPSKVHFAHNQSALNLDAQATLRLAAKVLSQHPALPIVIEGYADDTGSLTRNKHLSLKRAMAVKTYLLAQGIAADRMQVLGLGTIASSATKRSARQANPSHRRAQIKVLANADHAIRQQLLVHDDKVTVLCANRLPCVP